jgi:hypothetical protein
MDIEVKNKALEWLHSNIDQEAKTDIQRMLDAKDETELVDSFYKDLEFGTGGLRGIMGTGSNRINKYTIGKATQGLSNYLLKLFQASRYLWPLHTTAGTTAIFLLKSRLLFFLPMALRCSFLQSCAQLRSFHSPSGHWDAKVVWC